MRVRRCEGGPADGSLHASAACRRPAGRARFGSRGRGSWRARGDGDRRRRSAASRRSSDGASAGQPWTRRGWARSRSCRRFRTSPRGMGVDRARHARAAADAESPPARRRTWRSATRLDAIRLGRADVMFCGGTEAPVTPVRSAGFAAMRALSTRNDDPAAASRPFDARARRVRDRRRRRRARARGARARAGARRARSTPRSPATGCRPTRTTSPIPIPSGANAGACGADGAADAGIEPEDVGYVNAHGTSTPVGDAAETRVLKLVFGDTPAGAAGHLVHEGRNRAHPRRRRRRRGRLHGAGAAPRRPPADDQPEHAGSRVRSRLHRERRAHRAGRASQSRTRSASEGHNSVVVFRRWRQD